MALFVGRRREEQGLDQRALSEQAGVTQVTISGVETGATWLAVDAVLRLLAVLDDTLRVTDT